MRQRHRYEVWSYSTYWEKWIRDIYPDADSAITRYEDLLLFGEAVRPPRLANSPLPLKDRMGFVLSRMFKRPSFGQSRASATVSVCVRSKRRPRNSQFTERPAFDADQ